MPTTVPVRTVTADQARQLFVRGLLSKALDQIDEAVRARAAKDNYVEVSSRLTEEESGQVVEMLEAAGFHVVIDGVEGRDEALTRHYHFCISWAAETPWPEKPETPSEKFADKILKSKRLLFCIGVTAGVAVVLLGVQVGKLL